MRHHHLVRAAAIPCAAGVVLVLGGPASVALAPAPVAGIMLPQDCDVPGGQPGGQHASGSHGGHDMGNMGTMGGSGSGHGTSVTGPSAGSRTLVLGGFGALNAGVLIAAGALRRRTEPERSRRRDARSTALPASVTRGSVAR